VILQALVAILVAVAQAPATQAAPAVQRLDAKAEKSMAGFYEIIPTEGKEAGAKKYVYISAKNSGEFVLRDLKTSTEMQGVKRNDGALVFGKGPGTGSSTEELLFSGWPSDGVQGTMTSVGGGRTAIYAVKLVSLWECANHDTPHLAKSEKEMQDASAKYSCTGWHKAQAPK
jgi:hypothetical protein